jgi:hypothetical protein
MAQSSPQCWDEAKSVRSRHRDHSAEQQQFEAQQSPVRGGQKTREASGAYKYPAVDQAGDEQQRDDTGAHA